MRRLLHTFGTVAIYVLLYAVVSLLVGAFVDISDQSDFGFMLINLTVVVFVYVGLTIYERLVYGRSVRIMTSRRGLEPITVLWGVILLVSTSIVTSPLEGFLPPDNRVFPDGGWTLLATIGVAPIFEELIFRGRLISIFRQTCSPSGAILLSAALFAVAHGNFIVALNAFIAGVILGYFYFMRGSIFTPMILHICNNALAYAMMELSYQEMSAYELITSSKAFVVVYVVAAAITIVGLIHIINTLSRADYRTMRLEQREVEIDRQMEDIENTGVNVDLNGEEVKDAD